MGKSVYIAEKPSVAQEFAKALHVSGKSGGGYMENEDKIVTWCVGHLVTMSYPDAYDPALKKWSLKDLPFIPKTFKYEVIPSASKQFKVISSLLHRSDVDTIYVCTDSGREGEYIYRLVEQQAGVTGKKRYRVWIDSQTEGEILRGIREAKDLSAYDDLGASAYCRAKEDYLMGINFSRLLTLKYGRCISGYLNTKRAVISVGRVMTCVQGMVVKREREIRDFTETPFYRVMAQFGEGENAFEGEWRAVPGSKYEGSGDLYKENGFKQRDKAQALIDYLKTPAPVTGQIVSVEKKTEKKNPPLLFNLAELQNDCSRRFRISPDQTLTITQELYEKRLVTYPRTDARVLSSAVAGEINKNLNGLMSYESAVPYLKEIAAMGSHKDLTKTRYVDDTKITDHYAIIPTGEGWQNLSGLTDISRQVFDLIVRRFLSIFYPPAVYERMNIQTARKGESFFTSLRALISPGYLSVTGIPKKTGDNNNDDPDLIKRLGSLKKGMTLPVSSLTIREGKTSPPKRYTSGSLILAMENAGQLIEDEELRSQISGSGIGTSATRGDILKKLISNRYLSLQKKTQVVSPTLQGEMIYDVVDHSIRSLLNPELTASWERGLSYVAKGEVSEDEYMKKLTDFIVSKTTSVKGLENQKELVGCFDKSAAFYKKPVRRYGTAKRNKSKTREVSK